MAEVTQYGKHGYYAIRAFEDLICITKGKQSDIGIGIIQNIFSMYKRFEKNGSNKKKTIFSLRDRNRSYGRISISFSLIWMSFFCTSRNPINILFVVATLEEGSEEEKKCCVGRWDR